MRRVSLLRLIAVFTWTGLSSLGGGRSAYFHEALVRRRRLIGHDEFVQDFTLSQVLPGPNFSNLSVVLGHRLGGVAGGLWGLGSVVLPGALILLVATALYVRGAFSPSATLLMRGLSAAVVGLVLITALRIMRGSLRGGRSVLIAAATFAAVGPLRLPTVGVVLVMAALSFCLQWSVPPSPVVERSGPERLGPEKV
ncbi:MAG TPA: chromate transporter [Methylomirabilota bacterium]|nr:chromate transporter [Methylomirabilota bacterium]